jgi:hypothetical protein
MWVREEGRTSTTWSNLDPKVRCVRERGDFEKGRVDLRNRRLEEQIGELKESWKVKEMVERGKGKDLDKCEASLYETWIRCRGAW